MPFGDLLDLIVCTRCNTRVEYHDGPDGLMSCECWVRRHHDEPMPIHWFQIEDTKINLCAGCGKDIPERRIYRCSDCDGSFHRECLDHHCKHGGQKQELRSENLYLRHRVTDLMKQAHEREDYMLRGVAFRDELQARISAFEKAAAK